MIDKSKYKDASEEAYAYADGFRQEFSKKKKLDWTAARVGGRATAESDIMALFVRFLQAVTGSKPIRVDFQNSPYASWIGIDGKGNYSVLFNEHAMTNLCQVSGVPAHTQRIRAILHELGHIVLNHVRPPVAAGGIAGQRGIVLADKSTRPEEGQAWAFAFCFAAVLMADHAVARRVQDHDDVTIAANI